MGGVSDRSYPYPHPKGSGPECLAIMDPGRKVAVNKVGKRFNKFKGVGIPESVAVFFLAKSGKGG